MICSVRCTRRSPSSRRLGLRVKTLLYAVQTGEAQIMSKWPGANFGSGSHEQMSAQMVGSALGSTSSEVTSHPSSAKARPIEPVPEKSSSKRRIVSTVVFHGGLAGQPHDRDQGGAAAGQLEVAQGHLPPAERPRGRHVLIEEAGVAPPQGRGRVGHGLVGPAFLLAPV